LASYGLFTDFLLTTKDWEELGEKKMSPFQYEDGKGIYLYQHDPVSNLKIVSYHLGT